ncbi:MAG: PilZ domain-containing protein [Desulfobacteraceae bacterium]
MNQYPARGKQKIKETIEFLISQRREIVIQIEGQETSYISRIVKANYGDVYSGYGNGPQLVIERLSPEEGNTLVELSSQLIVEFALRNIACRFRSRYLGPRSSFPDSDLVVSYPLSIQLPQRRRRHRCSGEIPEFLSVVLRSKEGCEKDKGYELDVLDYSTNGVGILVKEKDADLLEIVQEGDRFLEMELFAPQTMVKVDGTVRHKSKKRDRKDELCYVIGIEFDEALADYNALQ